MESLQIIRTRGCKGSRGHHGPWDEWEHGLWARVLEPGAGRQGLLTRQLLLLEKVGAF